jgi:Ser/Thr protein kinase RdoA (MazF antagonist)
MYERFVPEALRYFGVSYDDILPVQKGYRNEIYPVLQAGETKLQLTFYKSEEGIQERIERADTVANWAATKGLPARTRADERTLVLTSPNRTVYAGLYHYLPGATIPWEAYTKEYIKQLGKYMSDLHAALASFDTTGQPSVIDESIDLLERMVRYFDSRDVQEAMRQKLNVSVTIDTKLILATFRKLRQLPAQQLHMDFVRGNVLFEDTEVTGILDFEKTAQGPVFFDVARTLAFLLVDCKYKTPSQVRKYFLVSGYEKRGAAQLPSYSVTLEILVQFFLLHDFYKFLRHTPYESLKENEHFQRTLSILLEEHVLHYT